MKKSGFTYIELIFSMAIVVVLMVASLPLLTRTKQTEVVGFGEYQCVLREIGGVTKAYERSRFNTSEFEEDFTPVDSCIFTRPLGVTQFDVTLVGGGSGGGSASTQTADITASYQIGSKSGTTEQEQDFTNVALKHPFIDNTILRFSELNIKHGQDDDKYIFTPNPAEPLESFNVNSAIFSQLADQVSLLPARGGKSGEISELTVNVGSMPFDNEGRLIIEECTGSTFPAATSICIGKPSGAGASGNWTFMRIDNPQLTNTPNTFCGLQNGSRFCFARGGEAPGPNADEAVEPSLFETVEPSENNNACLVVPGEPGMFDSRVATANDTGRPINREGHSAVDCTSNGIQPLTPTGIGVGGAGGTYIITKYDQATGNQLTFQLYNVARMRDENSIVLGDRYTQYLQGEKHPSAIDLRRNDENGLGGGGGGGAVFIRW